MKRVLAIAAASVLAACGGGSSDPDLSPYVTSATAEATYLSRTDAQATYLAQADAASTYLTQGSAVDLYLGQDAAATTYLSLDAAAATYLSLVDASAYLLASDADATFLTQSSAAAVYLTKADASLAYLTPAAASAAFLGQADAAATYLTKANAAATYLTSMAAATTYLTQLDAAVLFLTRADAAAYLTASAAAATYLSQADASSTYLGQADAAATYLSQASASASYLTKADAASTYQRPLQAACAVGQALRGFDQDGNPVCGMADCPAGFADCDGDPANGCEADLLSTSTCGACSNACGGGQKCWPGGACTTSLVTGRQLQQIDAWTGHAGTWNLCYRATRDGRNPATFHAQCNNRGSTFFVAQTSAGRLVGGFAGAPWQSTGNYRSDPSAFLFSLSSGFKHAQGAQNAIQTYLQYGIYDSPAYGPTFGGGHDFFTDLTNGYANLGYYYACRLGAYGQAACSNDFAGAYSFTISDLEVYAQQ